MEQQKKRRRTGAGQLCLLIGLALTTLGLTAALVPSAMADPVKVPAYDRKSKVWEVYPQLSTSAWTCFALADEVPASATDWRFAGLTIDTADAGESERSCWVTEVTTAAAASLDCDDADFVVPGALSAPWSDPELSFRLLCGRAVAGTPQTTITAPY